MHFTRRDMMAAIAAAATAGAASAQTGGAVVESADAQRMRRAAADFLSAIGRDPAASFAFDSDARTRWHWFPRRFYQAREGRELGALSPDQRDAADALLAASTTPDGYAKAKGIMRLQEKLGRSAGDFQISVYGEPGARAWGWSLEGHHLSLNYTVVDGRVAAGPLFLGARPTVVPEWSGVDRAPMRVEEETARALLLGLSPAQRAAVLFAPETPGDTITRSRSRVAPLPTEGLPLSDLAAEHRGLALDVVREYVSAMPSALADATFERVAATPDDQLWFGWSGAAQDGLYYYRLSGPGWFIEHDNSRNNATHIHSVWRDVENDFGRKLLAG